MPLNAALAHFGMSVIGTKASPSLNGLGFSGGTCTSSKPFFCTRHDLGGKEHFLFVMTCPPAAKESESRESIALAALGASL